MKHGVLPFAAIGTGAAKKTLLQLVAATNHEIDITEVSIGFDGDDNTEEPVLVQLIRQSTTGTMSAGTIVHADDNKNESFDTTAQHTATGEPTGTTVVRAWMIHPQTDKTIPIGPEAPITVSGGDRLGLCVTAAVGHNASGYICFSE